MDLKNFVTKLLGHMDLSRNLIAKTSVLYTLTMIRPYKKAAKNHKVGIFSILGRIRSIFLRNGSRSNPEPVKMKRIHNTGIIYDGNL